MTKSDLLQKIELLRLAAEQLPENADIDCAMVFESDTFGLSASIALRDAQEMEKAATAFGVGNMKEIDCGDRTYRFFSAGGVRISVYVDK